MATLYLDFENGNDDYAGSSFALKASGTDGTIVGSTFTSATASFPNDGSLIGQYLSIFNGTFYGVYNITAWVSSTSLTIAVLSGGTGLINQAARQYYIGGRWKNLTTGATAVRIIPGDTLRIMGSPAPTSLGQTAVWTSQALQAAKTVQAAANTTPISITCTAHGYSTGDTVVITSISGNTNAIGTWEITVTGTNTFTLDGSTGNGSFSGAGGARLRNNTRVKLATAVTQNIASTGFRTATWTSVQGAAVVTSFDTTVFKEHNRSDSFQSALGATTGLMAYYTLPSTLNLSGYQQVSFWFYHLTGTGTVDIELRLCSDSLGAVAVNTVDVPIQVATRRWTLITVDLGTALGSSINSVGVYSMAFNGATTFLLNNIIACKASSAADSLTLSSLIGKNTTGETFWGIQSINGTRVMLDADTSATPISTFLRGYYGTSETVTTWKRETIKLGPVSAVTTALQTIQESGTDGSPITYSAGWDRTNMSTQNLETWLDGVNGNGYGIVSSAKSFISLEKLAFARFNRGYSCASTSAALKNNYAFIAANNNSVGAFIADLGCTIEIISACANNTRGLDCSQATGEQLITSAKLFSNGTEGLQGYAFTRSLQTWSAKNNNSFGVILSFCFDGLFPNCELEANAGGGVQIWGNAYFRDCLVNDATEVSFAYDGSVLFSHNHDQTPGNHKIFMNGALISSATDQRKTASGISWKIQPAGANRNSSWPVTLSLAKVACAANSLVTIKAWMRRDNTGLTMRLVCKGSQIAGVTSDVVSAMTAAANTWEELTITFTPTEIGVVEITAESWGGSTYSGWVDDMTISQA
jgi:hypothetical protein